MKANEIAEPLKRFLSTDSPYRCILVDGKWGIGKTYEVNQALQEVKRLAHLY